MRKIIRYFFAPAVWLSGRLSFSGKYLLIGFLVFISLTALSLPTFKRAHEESRLAEKEREGLKTFVLQTNVLVELVFLRSHSISYKQYPPLNELTIEFNHVIEKAREDNLIELADKLNSFWFQVSTLTDEENLQRRFAVQTGLINTLLNLITESSRLSRLNVDNNLDVAFDMLINKLPLVLDTLGKQQDALTLDSENMESYALGAQVVLTESVSSLKSGIDQLALKNKNTDFLRISLNVFLQGISKQQDTADKVLGEPKVIEELQSLTVENLEIAQELLNDSVSVADNYLKTKILWNYRSKIIIGSLLIGTALIISYLFVGIYLSTLRSLKSLSDGTRDFCQGRLNTRIKIDTQDELVLVARNFNTVASEFEQLLEVIREQNESRERELETQVRLRTAELAEKNSQLLLAGKRVQEELYLASSMQSAILPQEFPNEPNWAVFAIMFAARELGGDFYDCFTLPDGRYGVVIADVSGKGVGAAFFMAVSRTVILDQAMRGGLPSEVLASSNNLLCERNPMELFVTACYGIFNPANGEFVYASAGHHPPLLRKINKTVEILPHSCDVALGILSEMDYSNQCVFIEKGDALLLYTDGVTEAFSADNEAYGDERLKTWFSMSAPEITPSILVNQLVADVAKFVNGAEASDDLTCLILCQK